ncbi:MAG: hypothetical protein V4813_05905 [Gemmatimonadota bacterium]
MSSQTERLERAAAEERQRLGEYLDQLQERFEKALDPGMIFDRHPLPVLAAALVGGVVLGAVTQSDGPPRHLADYDARPRRRSGIVHDGWQQLRGAVVGMIVARVAEKVHELTSSRRDDRDERPRKRSTARAAERMTDDADAFG